MNKSELIDSVANNTGESRRVVSDIIDALISTVQEQVRRGEKVSLLGFGTFEKRHRAAWSARNPQTGKRMHVAATDVPAFKVGQQFKRDVSVYGPLPGEDDIPPE